MTPHKTSRRQRIGVDCRLAGQRHAGIGRYVENLISRLPALAPEIDWIYFFHDAEQAAEISGWKQKNVELVYVPVRHYTVQEQLLLPRVFGQKKLDLLHVPHFNVPIFYRGKMIITIHDLLWHEYKGNHVTTLPAWKYRLKYGLYRYTVNSAISRAQTVLVPAETIRKTVSKQYPVAKRKIIVTPEGVDTDIFLVGRSQASLRGLKKGKNILYVGSLYPHKNIRLVIDALHQLSGYTLMLVGSRNVFQEEVEKYVSEKGLSRRVFFLGHLSDSELAEVFPNVTALVQPSLSEGFGLTGIEAMASGVPVLASRIPIFEEIYQDAAIFFDPKSTESLIKAVKSLVVLDRQKLILSGKKVAAQYSWSKMVEQTLAAYQQLLA